MRYLASQLAQGLRRATSALVLIAGAATVVCAQSPITSPIFQGQVYTWLLQNPPQKVLSASISLVGGQGTLTNYFWIVSRYTIGNSNIAGPYVLYNAPSSFSSGNYAVLSWTPADGAATGYDLLMTTTPAPPAGTCTCAVATNLNNTTYSVQSSTLTSYTVNTFDPNTVAISGVNKQYAPGVSALTFQTPSGALCQIRSDGTASCGTGSSSFNPHSPGPIGDVTPSTISATSYNNVIEADVASGADLCAKVNTALGLLPSTGGTVDARGLQGSQSCGTTVTISKAATILLGAATITCTVSPCFNFTSGDANHAASLIGQSWKTAITDTTTNGIVIQGTTANTSSVTIQGLRLNGSSNTAAFGVFAPQGAGWRFIDLDVEQFSGVGIFDTGALPFIGGWTGTSYNGGEGVVWGTDSTIGDFFNSAFNGSVGLHIIGGSAFLAGFEVNNNGHDGIYWDGVSALDWSANTLITRPNFYQPTASNPSNWNFYPIAIGTTGGSAPSWSSHYTSGAIFTDGTMKWVAVAPAGDPSLAGVGSASFGSFNGGWVDDNGMTETGGFVSDNLRIEGTVAHSANRIRLNGVFVSQGAQRTVATHGINVIYANNITITGAQWTGSDCYGGDADLGGIIFNNVMFSEINGFKSICSSQNPVRLIASTFNQLNNIQTTATNQDGTQSAANSACLYLDSTSANNQIPTLACIEGANGRGLYNLSPAVSGVTVVGHYYNTSSASPTDSVGATSILSYQTGNGSQQFYIPTGANFSWQIAGTAKMYLDVTHFYLYQFAGGGNVQPLCSDNTGGVYTGAGCAFPLTLTGTTASIGGGALTAGNCTSGTATVSGATAGHPVVASPSDGSLPGALYKIDAVVTATNTVTVQLCAIANVTPPAKTYNVVTQ